MRTRGTTQSVREYFDREVDGYLRAYASRNGSARGEIFQERRRLVLACLDEPLGRMLDVGSGPGVFAKPLLGRAQEYWMVDLSPEMLRRARVDLAGCPEAPSTRYQVADVESLPFRDGSFQTVLCVGVLSYLGRPAAALAELSRVTQAGGQVIISFPNRRSPLNRLHRGLIRFLRRGRELLHRLGVELRPRASRLTFREDIPNASFVARELEAMARVVGLRADRCLYLSLHVPFAIPGCRALVRAWDRLANRAIRSGWMRAWGREVIMRFHRDACAARPSPPAR